MLSLGQVKVGQKIIFRANPHEVLAANHLKMGRGGAKLVTKLRNLLDQTVYEYTFAGDERLEEADISYRHAQYLYNEGATAHCMANDDFSQFSLVVAKERLKFLKEGTPVDLMLWNNQAIDIMIPKKVELKVTYTEPGFKGDSTSATLKTAELESGASLQVPLFITIGDTVRVNTETGSYDSRV